MFALPKPIEWRLPWRCPTGLLRRGLPVTILLMGLTGLLSPLPVRAQPESAQSKPLLWRIGTDPVSYLFGTIHIADPRVLALPAVVETAFTNCSELRTEIPLDSAALSASIAGLRLPEGQTLKDLIPPRLYQRLSDFFEARDMDMAALSRMKPWVIAASMGALEAKEYAFDPPLDQQLHQRAVQAGMGVGGLETVAEQLAILDSMTLEEEIQLLEETLTLLQEETSYLEELILAYLAGQEEVLLAMAYTIGDSGEDPALQRYLTRLVDDRNTVMAHRIVGLLETRPEQRFFFAVGAGHMGGPHGILQQLRDQQIPVERAGP